MRSRKERASRVAGPAAAAFLCAGLVLAAPAARAALSSSDAGEAAGQFLRLGAGARASAMSGAVGAQANGADAVYWNPAGLARGREWSASLMRTQWLDSVQYDYAALSTPRASWGALGLAVQHVGMERIASFDNAGTPAGSFRPSDVAVSAAWGRSVFGWPVGVALKYVRSRIDESASALAVDAGIQGETGKFQWGAAVRNAGGRLRYREAGDPLPLNLRLASAVQATSRWLLALDVDVPLHDRPSAALGVEYSLPVGDSLALLPRAGVNTSPPVGGSHKVAWDTRAFTMGLGVRLSGWSVDYAFVPYGELSSTHHVSLGLRFGRRSSL